MFALVDANNFYVMAHTIGRPSLKGQPVVVLSSNDGNAVARSQEAKALGVKMGQPYFELRDLELHHGLICLSSNMELYADISDRVMTLAAGLGPTQEIYSCDESWISGLDGIPNLTDRARRVRARIAKWVGVPTCIGLAPTKTLAKFCNHVAKEAERKPGSYPAELAQVCNWRECSEDLRVQLLRATAAGEVWGIGRKVGARLAENGILTAWDVARMPAEQARAVWGVMLERTVRELQGISCIPMELEPPPRQQIACTRSFGHPITTLPPLEEAVSEFASKGAFKLRAQRLRAASVLVFLRTSPFRPGRQFSRSVAIPLQPPSSDTTQIVAAALRGLRSIYAPGYMLAKAGVLLLDLSSQDVQQMELLAGPVERDHSALMEAVDKINGRFGRGAVQLASSGYAHTDESGWRQRQEMPTPRFTTRLDEIPIARA